MSAPEPLPALEEGQPQGLWGAAPGWRTMTIVSGALTVLAAAFAAVGVSLPENPSIPATSVSVVAAPNNEPTQAAIQPTVCLMRVPPAPILIGKGIVTGFDSAAQAQARIQYTQSQTKGQIDPAYVSNLRAHVRLLVDHEQITALVRPGMPVQLGDLVEVQGTFRSAGLPCNYVPDLIDGDFGRPPASVD